MAATLTIGGADYASWLKRESLHHVDDLTSNPDTLTFDLNSTNAAGTVCTKPVAGAEVIYTLATGRRLFGGVLADARQAREGFLTVGYSCTCTDYRTWADRKLLNDRFAAQTAGAIVVALFAKYAPEFDTSQVNTTGGPVLQFIRFKRSDRLTGALARLAGLVGFFWDITPNKHVLFAAVGSLPAPFGLLDGSLTFKELTATPDRSTLANRITVKGAKYPSSQATRDPFTGDGLTTAFRLSKTPYGLDTYNVFAEAWGSFAGAVWTKVDVSNPSPPAGHVSTDGYIFTTTQQGGTLTESGRLQVVGGDGVWGDSRVAGVVPQLRGDGFRRFEFDVYADGGGHGRVGLWDPAASGTPAGEQHGVIFNAGVLVPSEGGVAKTALATVNYTLGHAVRVRFIPKLAGGCVTYVNTDDTGDVGLPVAQRVPWRSSLWTKLYDSSVGALPQFTLVPIFNQDFIGRIGRIKIQNRLYGVAVTVAAVAQTVGLLNVDNDGGLDCLMGLETADAPVLAFFADTAPANGAAVVATYNESIPVLVMQQDGASVAAVKALENPSNLANGSDGIYDGYVEDTALDSLDLARRRAAQELLVNGNPMVTLEFTTYTDGLAAGQLMPVSLTAAKSGRDLAGTYLIQKVETTSMGSDNYSYHVSAGSRLKGIAEYLIDLLMDGKKLAAQQDDNAPLDQGMAQVDIIGFTDSTVIVPGAVGPYNYAGWLQLESGGFLLQENGSKLLLNDNVGLYGMATYA